MADTLTFAVLRTIGRVNNNGGKWGAFAIDGELRLARPGSQTFRKYEREGGDCLVGIYDCDVKIESLLGDMKCFFTDDEVGA